MPTWVGLKRYSIQGVLQSWFVAPQQRQIEVYQRHQKTLEKSKTLFASDLEPLTARV
jgi:Uma2 family endonuclease